MSKVSGGIPDTNKKSAVNKLILAKQGDVFYPGLVLFPIEKSGMMNVYFFKFKEIRKVFSAGLLYNLTDFIGGDVSYNDGAQICTGRMDAVKEKNTNISVLVSSPPKKSKWKDISDIFITMKQQEPSVSDMMRLE